MVVATMVGSACGGRGASGTETRTVLVDFSHDELVTSMVDFFPQTVQVRAGDTVRFRQFWTGEAHNVTFGRSFNDALGGERGPFVVNQNGAQPCHLDEGLPPTSPDQPCPKRAQPDFTGRESYYCSGFIPHVGKGANQFDMRLATDIEPGRYNHYCTLHGVGQSGTVVVVPDGRPIPSQSEVSSQAQRAVERDFATPFRDAIDTDAAGRLTIAGNPYRPPLAGVAVDGIRSWTGVGHQRHLEHRHGSVNRFVPALVKTRVCEPVTWTFTGRHTVSFNVPEFFPIFSVAGSGQVTINPDAHRPIGFPGRPRGLPATQRATVDAGTWDGRGFRSSGLDWNAGGRFSVSFGRPGTYLLACLIHPEMVGKVEVEG